MLMNGCSFDLWDIPTGRGVEEVISNKLESSTSACISTLIVQILYSVDQLSAIQVRRKGEFNPGGSKTCINTLFCSVIACTGKRWMNVIHLEVSLYCMAPNRIPDSPTELANGLTIPAIKPFTCRKLALPILEDPSTKKTISAACTLLHLPAKWWRIYIYMWTYKR